MKTIRFKVGKKHLTIPAAAAFFSMIPPMGSVSLQGRYGISGASTWLVKLNNGVNFVIEFEIECTGATRAIAKFEDKDERVVRAMVELYEAVYVEGQQ